MAGSENGGTRSVERAIDILKALGEGPEVMGVSTLAHQLGLSKATVYRLLQTLVAKGMVAYIPGLQAYRLGGGVLQLGLRVQDRLPLRKEAEGTLQQLRDITGETAVLFLVVGERCVAMEQAITHQEPRRTMRLGSTAPLHLGATGRVLLSFLPADFRDAYLRKLAVEDHDPAATGSIDEAFLERIAPEFLRDAGAQSLDEYRHRLDLIRMRGHEVSTFGEGARVHILAFPLRNVNNVLLGGIAILGLPERWTEDLIEAQLPACKQLIDDLCLRLRYMEPDAGLDQAVPVSGASSAH